MKLSIVQFSPEWENKEENKSRIKSLLNNECRDSVIIFPEMTLTGFTMKASDNAELLNGRSFLFFSGIAKEYNSYIAAGIIEFHEERSFNTMICINPAGELQSAYRKIHPFSYSSENIHYAAGEQPVTTDIQGIKTGLSICYDLRFPELYRMYAKERVEFIIDIANWPDTRIEHWRALLKARAIENQCYMAGVNRTGKDPKLNYPGYSSVFDPMGKEIVTLVEEEGILHAVIDGDYVKEVRAKLPFLNDMVLI
jgi:omega-amidase